MPTLIHAATARLPILLPAQLGGAGGGGEPPRLPAPPALESMFLETWWPALLLVVAGVATFIILSRRPATARRALPIGAALIVLGIAAAAISYTTTTRREALNVRTEELIAAVARTDEPALQAILAADATASVAALNRELSRDAILNFVATNMKNEYAVKEFAILNTEAVIDGPNSARTQARVRVTPEAYPVPVLTWWRLHWRQDPSPGGLWRLTRIEGIGGR
ncbi:MAG: hypothetical protein H7Y88_02670 [Phycisphaerales bacterium]|nr:hypothetical protein [Phycisphaerales bacterium]